MKYEFHPEAKVDLVETVLYYETQALGLGGRFAAISQARDRAIAEASWDEDKRRKDLDDHGNDEGRRSHHLDSEGDKT